MELENKTPKLNQAIFIDDDEYTIELHRLLAKDCNLAKTISTYLDPKVALEELASIEHKNDFPELMICDINMPSMNGHQFVRELSKMVGYDPSRTVVSFLTSSREITDVVQADDSGVAEFYHWKPLTIETLAKIVRDGFNINLD